MSRTAHKLLSASGAKGYEIEQSLLCSQADGSKLRRTPSSEGNRKTWTFSTWCKRGRLGLGNNSGVGSNWNLLMGAYAGSASDNSHYWQFGFSNNDELTCGGWVNNFRVTNRKFRDTSAWYHLVLQVDTTQSTASNRTKVYVNGVQETSFSSTYDPAQNFDLAINNTVAQSISDVAYDAGSGPYHFDGYIAETHLFDGAVVAASEFGETDPVTGQWIPKEYTGTASYGTNGYYMKYVSGAIGTDSSGQGNNYTTTNLANSDVVLDSPTNNFPTINSTTPYNSTITNLSQGNLHVKAVTYDSGYYGNHIATVKVPESGKWYIETRMAVESGTGNTSWIGVMPQTAAIIPKDGTGATDGEYITNSSFTGIQVDLITGTDTIKLRDGGSIVETVTGKTASSYVCALALDVDNNKVYAGFDNGSSMTWMDSGNPAAGSNGQSHTFTSDTIIQLEVGPNSTSSSNSKQTLNFGQNGTFCGTETAGGNTDGSGQGNFFYSPPSGFKALCSKNLPTPTIKKPTEHFNTVLYTGDGSSTRSITGAGFQSDFTWLKSRTEAYSHLLYDAVRGAGASKALKSNASVAEGENDNATYGYLSAFTSDGFNLVHGSSSSSFTNENNDNMVSWNWKAGGSGSANNSGDINATVSANVTAGFSIVSWTGNSSNGDTIAHGLGKEPSVIIYKDRSANSLFYLVTTAIDGSQDYLALGSNTLAAASTWGAPATNTISNWTFGANSIIAYCFAAVEGFSKFGSYKGNGESENGPYVYTGFSPALVIVKESSSALGSWFMWDNKREVGNVKDAVVWADVSNAETSHAEYEIDFLSNGFKIRGDSAATNQDGETMFYMAFAEFPFKYANAR